MKTKKTSTDSQKTKGGVDTGDRRSRAASRRLKNSGVKYETKVPRGYLVKFRRHEASNEWQPFEIVSKKEVPKAHGGTALMAHFAFHDPLVKYEPTLPDGFFIKYIYDEEQDHWVRVGVVASNEVPASEGGTRLG